MVRRIVLLAFAIGLFLTQAAVASGRERSRAVEVLWGGTYYTVEILGVRGGQYRVHYTD